MVHAYRLHAALTKGRTDEYWGRFYLWFLQTVLIRKLGSIGWKVPAFTGSLDR